MKNCGKLLDFVEEGLEREECLLVVLCPSSRRILFFPLYFTLFFCVCVCMCVNLSSSMFCCLFLFPVSFFSFFFLFLAHIYYSLPFSF